MRVIPDPAEAAVLAREIAVMATTEDVELIRRALAYAIELYRELTGENGAPTLGTQNQIVDFILADRELRETVTGWGRTVETDEATTRPRQRLPYDDAYRRIRDFAQSRLDQPVFMPPNISLYRRGR